MSDNVLQTAGRSIYRLGFEISPIILVDGIATYISGGYLPIVSILEAGNFATGLLSGGTDLSLDAFFAHFEPIPGGELIKNAIGKYPFANQSIAANAIITQPLNISLRMVCPVNRAGGYGTRLATMSALKFALDMHTQLGGTYVVATPVRLYLNCLLTSLKDVTPGDSAQVQTHWQWDFEQPLLSLSAAAQVMNSLMRKLTDGVPTDGSLSGAAQTAGSQLSGAAPSTIPAAVNLSGVSASPPPPSFNAIGGVS